MAKRMTMEDLATKVAEDLYEGDPEADLVTREIASSDDKDQAIERLETLKAEVERALEIVRGASAPEHCCDDDCRSYGCQRGRR